MFVVVLCRIVTMITEKSEAASLFEKLTIKEIQDIEKKTRNEIEKRREDLRQMVGERYRDLIEAADTIRDMKSSVESVSSHVANIHDFNFKEMPSEDDVNDGNMYFDRDPAFKERFYTVAAQVHFLLDIPEKIWNYMEKGDNLSAAILYLMAEDVHASLKFEQFPNCNAPLKDVFPVVTRHWTSCAHFHASILKQCHTLLQSRGVNESNMASSLCAILLLTKKSPRDLCNIFLEAQMNALKCILKTNQPSNAKDQTVEVVKVISESLRLFKAIFNTDSSSTGKQSLLLSTFQEIEDMRKGKEIIRLVLPVGIHWIKYIPQSLQNFTPELTCATTDFSDDFLKDSCISWLAKVKVAISPDLKEILSYVGTIKGMAIIRKAVMEQINETNEVHMSTLLETKFNLWQEFLNPIFIQQIQFIITSCVNATVLAIKNNLESAKNLIRDGNEKQCAFERDLSKFVWIEGPFDIPVGQLSAKKRVGNVTLKAKGFTPTVEMICSDFDERLMVLLEDVAYIDDLCEESKGDVQIANDVDVLHSFIKEICLSVIDSLLELMQSPAECIVAKDTNVVDITLFYARLCLAIGDLCPHLQKAIVAPATKTKFKVSDVSVLRHQLTSSAFITSMSKNSEDPVWRDIKIKLSNKSIECLSVWKNVLKTELSCKFEGVFSENPAIFLKNIPQWDTVEIQEESEDGVSMNSTILVPFQPSFHLEESLYWVCSRINTAGGHTIPRSVLLSLQDDLLDAILKSFEDHLRKSTFNSQTIVLQFLFDLRFITGLLMHNADEKNRDRVQKINDELEAGVDPFDLDVFSPYINENLKRCVHRSTVLLGPLSGSDHLALGSSSRPPALSHQEQYNVIPLSVGCKMRFSLLPLGSSSSERTSAKRLPSTSLLDNAENLGSKDEGGESFSQTLSSRSSSQSLKITKSASTSFFGAMSSSWFGN